MGGLMIVSSRDEPSDIVAAHGGSSVVPRYRSATGGVRVRRAPAAITSASSELGNTPVKRAGSPDDPAPTAVYLASEMAVFVTGAETFVDGGRTAA